MTTLTATTTILATIAGTIVALATLRRAPDRARNHLKTETDILANLPQGSPAHANLLAHVEEQVRLLAQRRRVGRDWRAVALMTPVAVILIGLPALYTADPKLDLPTALAVLMAITVPITLALIAEALMVVERDHRGHRVPQRRR